jgi:tetratricopeptide (TPR) repeat protein
MNKKILYQITASIIFLALLVLYYIITKPALNGVFLFDDFSNLQNLKLISGQWDEAHIRSYLVSFPGSPGRPISALSFLVNDEAWPSNPYGFKFTNLMIHLLNSILLFGLLRQLAITCPNMPQSLLWPLLAMAAWLFHPLQLSAQMLVVQRMTLLSATFSFAGLWAYTYFINKTSNALHAFITTAALGLATILAFLSKENGALLPLLAWALNATLLSTLLSSKSKTIQRIISTSCIVPSLLVIAGIIAMGIGTNAYSIREFTLIERLYTQSHVLIDYIQKIIMPRLSGSGIYHDDYPIYRSLGQQLTWLCITGLAGLFIFSVWIRKRHPIISFAVLWFFAGHAMESSFVALELYFEHRNYLPLLGPILALSAWPFLLSRHIKKIALTIFSIWLVILITITALQSPVWGTHALMATFWAKEKPQSLRATQELARFHYENQEPQQAVDVLMGAYSRGIQVSDLPMGALLTKCWVPSIKTNEDIYVISRQAIIMTRHSNASLDALKRLREAMSENQCPELLDQKKWWDLTELMLNNKYYKNNSESFIRIERAKTFIQTRDLNGAMHELEIAYSIDPSTELSQKIAEILISAGLIDEAIIWLRKGLLVKRPYFDELISNEKEYSRKLINILEHHRKIN